MVPPTRAATGRREVHARHRRVELRVRPTASGGDGGLSGQSISRLNFCSSFLRHRCILGELFTKRPIFQANQELAQLELIRWVR